MSEAFLRALRWYIMSFLIIAGTTAFIIAERHDTTKPIIIGVLGYGFTYIMLAFWREFRGRLLFSSMVVFMLIAGACPYIPSLFEALFAKKLEMDEFFLWGFTTAVVGIPVMMALNKFNDR